MFTLFAESSFWQFVPAISTNSLWSCACARLEIPIPLIPFNPSTLHGQSNHWEYSSCEMPTSHHVDQPVTAACMPHFSHQLKARPNSINSRRVPLGMNLEPHRHTPHSHHRRAPMTGNWKSPRSRWSGRGSCSRSRRSWVCRSSCSR